VSSFPEPQFPILLEVLSQMCIVNIDRRTNDYPVEAPVREESLTHASGRRCPGRRCPGR